MTTFFPRCLIVLFTLYEVCCALEIERIFVERQIQKRDVIRVPNYPQRNDRRGRYRAPQPKVLKIGHDDVVSILEGKVLTLVCKAKGSPAPNIMWYKDNQPITARDGRVSVKSNNKGRIVKLKIQSTSTDDAGNYTCRAENQNGFIKKWVYVAVESNVIPTERATTAPVPTLTPKDEAPPYTRRPDDPVLELCMAGYCANGECYIGEDKKMHCKCSSPYGGPRCTLPHASPLPSHNGNKTAAAECIGPDADCGRSVDRTLTYAGIGLAGIFLIIILGISYFMARYMQRRKDWRLWRRKSKPSYSSKSAGAAGLALAMDGPSRRTSVRTVGVDVATDVIYIENGERESPMLPPRPSSAYKAPAPPPSATAGTATTPLPRSVSFPADIEAPPTPPRDRNRFGTLPTPTGGTLPTRPSPQDFAYHPLRSLPSGESGFDPATGVATTAAATLPRAATPGPPEGERKAPSSPRLVAVTHTRPRPPKDYPRTAADSVDETEVWIKQGSGSDSIRSTSNPLYSDSTTTGSLSTSSYVPAPPPTASILSGRATPVVVTSQSNTLPLNSHPNALALAPHASSPRRCLPPQATTLPPPALKPPKEVNFKDDAHVVKIAHRHPHEGPWERQLAHAAAMAAAAAAHGHAPGVPGGYVTFSNIHQERVCICPTHTHNGPPSMPPPPPRLTTFTHHNHAPPQGHGHSHGHGHGHGHNSIKNVANLPNHRPH